MTGAARRVVLAGLPAPLYEAALGYLGDVLRECQLVLVGQGRGGEDDPDLVALAEGLVPDLEELRDVFARAENTQVDGHRRLEVDLRPSDAATLAHLHLQLGQLRFVERHGGVLLPTDPEVANLLAWVRDEAAEQLAGRMPRTYRVV
ncbi:MAG: hypothetical protein KF703_03830 [Actinobacteria bacterium]|nr:hypothetical protein [Actinomycetota bacterium]